MSALTTQICTVLKSNLALAQHTGGRVYNNRPLKRTGYGSMPEAFDANSRVKFSLVVMDEGSIGDLGRDNVADQSITVWMHGPLNPDTLELMSGLAYEQVLALLDHEFVATNGTGVDLSVGDQLGAQEDPTMANAYVGFVRFSATRLWR